MVSSSTPAVVIAAPASGSGKTTVATGLIGALRRSGSSVAPFKVGPDYIDPGYHGLAAGRPGRNLDTVLVGPDRIGPLYRHGTGGCDIAVVEGVMGLFDGKIDEANSQPSAEGSTAQVASILGAPVVLVIDARGHGRVWPPYCTASRRTTQVCASAASYSTASGALVTSRCCVMRATRSASQCSEWYRG